MEIKLFALLLCLISLSRAASISRTDFNEVLKKTGYPAASNSDVYKYFAETTSKFSREETAMLLSHLLIESAGFVFKEEQACLRGNRCAGKYKDSVGLPDKNYHGRGYIQLSWGANYKAASMGLGMGDKLLRNPELVSQDIKTSMHVSVWYWEKRVKTRLTGPNKNNFGVTTKAINGIECTNASLRKKAQDRYRIYLKVAEVLKIQNKAKENGCYS
ncbi:endochitinase At2g43610-like [Trichogramma pretiosum]|uniref:endochitinase At2g43610-like n=1 Tax=Trichogramma pretiosum TaxID=7493 RepID=UPI0006C94F1E|nr:endochitinase At2g43610-like [Trichogramma pretiosum]